MTRSEKFSMFLACMAFAGAPHAMVPFMQWTYPDMTRYEVMNTVSTAFAFVYWPLGMMLVFIFIAATWNKSKRSNNENDNG